MPVRRYPLIQDSGFTPIFGGDDGTKFYSQKIFNIQVLPNADSDDGDGYAADFGVHDSDVITELSLNNYQVKNPTTDGADETLTFSPKIHEVVIDTSRCTQNTYVELGAIAASLNSIVLPAGGLYTFAVETTVIHMWSIDHTKIQVRGM